jgi:hypothetical protein
MLIADAPPLFGLFVLAIILLIVLVAVVLVIVAAILIGFGILVLTIFGIFSASVLAGLARRRVSSGVRTFICCLGTFAGIPVGAAGLYVLLRLFHQTYPFEGIMLCGATAGGIAGLLAAMLVNWSWTAVLAEVARRFKQSPDRAFPINVARVSNP